MTQPSTAEQFAAFFEELMRPRDLFATDIPTTTTKTHTETEENDQ